jgi:glycosyltransferase involved in cell wall biosynthesis
MKATHPVHVLMVIESHYPARGGGGAESQLRTLARGLREQGHRVTVLTPLSRLGPQERISRVDGVPVCRLPFPRVRWLATPALWLACLAFLWRRRRRYDAWHCHIGHHLSALTCALGASLGKPTLVKIAGGWEFAHALAPRRSLLSRLTFAGLSRATRWQAISQRIAGALIEQGVPREQLLVIPNAVDTRRFRAIAPSPAPEPRFLFLGRLARVKALDVLLDAFAEALREGGPAQLRLVGTGRQEPALRAQAEALGIADRVHFEGHRGDLEQVLRDADVAVLPSHQEGLSNTLLECMSAGLPMVVSRVSGSEDLVRHEVNGWMCEPGDRAGLARCLREAIACSPETRRAMGERARHAVESYASLPRVLERLLEVYRGDAPDTAEAAPAHALPGAREG